jgi:pyrroline-5-carboxylate reductase
VSYRLAIVGAGRLGGALAEGLLASGFEPADLVLVQRNAAARERLQARLASTSVVATFEEAGLGPETGVVLAVKPDYAESVAREIGLLGVTRLLSVVAGLSTARLEAVFAGPVAVIRAIPNTPVLVRKGVSAIAGGAHVTRADLEWAESILGSVGLAVRVTERQLEAVTGLSGAMPAYLYLVVEALIEAGVHQGLARDVARQLVIGTFEGSAALLVATGESPEELRAQVTSPGGVTAAGLRVLEGRAVRAAFLDAVVAAAERGRQMGR